MRKSDFRADRDNNYDPTPTEEMSLREKIEHQRKIRKAWEAAECPADLPWLPMDCEWWQDPYGIPQSSNSRLSNDR
jgi:hypothetical protein